jgi:hypothetical protein
LKLFKDAGSILKKSRSLERNACWERFSKVSGSGRIILSYINVRGPALESVYQIVRKHETASFDMLTDLFSIPETSESSPQTGQLRDCLNFLEGTGILRIIEKSKTEEVAIASNFGERPFKLVLLNRLRSDKKNPFHLVHSHLVSYDIVKFEISGLKQSVEKALDLGFTWTDEKLNFWMDLADYLGLGRKYASWRSFVSYPTPELVQYMISDFRRGKKVNVNLRKFLEYVSSSYFECFTREGKLFEGLQQTLLYLQRKGLATLRPAASDDPNTILLGGKPYASVSLEGR